MLVTLLWFSGAKKVNARQIDLAVYPHADAWRLSVGVGVARRGRCGWGGADGCEYLLMKSLASFFC